MKVVEIILKAAPLQWIVTISNCINSWSHFLEKRLVGIEGQLMYMFHTNQRVNFPRSCWNYM